MIEQCSRKANGRTSRSTSSRSARPSFQSRSTPLPPGVTPGPGGTVTYTIKAGDTLSGIANQFGITVEDIVKTNNIADPNAIQEGEVLVIPVGAATPAAAATATAAPSPPKRRQRRLDKAIGVGYNERSSKKPTSPREVPSGIEEVMPMSNHTHGITGTVN